MEELRKGLDTSKPRGRKPYSRPVLRPDISNSGCASTAITGGCRSKLRPQQPDERASSLARTADPCKEVCSPRFMKTTSMAMNATLRSIWTARSADVVASKRRSGAVRGAGLAKAKIYPDFIFAVSRKEERRGSPSWRPKAISSTILDTAYKREVLTFMAKNFRWDSTVAAGTLELIKKTGETIDMTLILMSEWKSKLPTYLKP